MRESTEKKQNWIIHSVESGGCQSQKLRMDEIKESNKITQNLDRGIITIIFDG